MKCDTCKELLIDYLADELSDDQRVAFEQAVTACTECAETLSAYQTIYAAYDHFPELEVPEKMTEAILREARFRSEVPEPWFQRLWSPSLGGILAAAAIAGAAAWVLTQDPLSPSRGEPSPAAEASQVAMADEPALEEESVAELPVPSSAHQLGGDRPPPHAQREQAAAPEVAEAPAATAVPADAAPVAFNVNEEAEEGEAGAMLDSVDSDRTDRRGGATGTSAVRTTADTEMQSTRTRDREEERSARPSRNSAAVPSAPSRQAEAAPEPEPEPSPEPAQIAAAMPAEAPQMGSASARGGGEATEGALAYGDDLGAAEETTTTGAVDGVDLYAAGVAAYERGDYRAAIDALDAHRAVAGHAEPALTRFYLGAAYYQRDRFDDARRHLEAYLQAAPSGARASDARALLEAIEVAHEPMRLRREAVDSAIEADESGR